MASYEDFFPYVLPDVIGAPEPLVVHHIRNACIEFCEKSLILTRDHDPVTVIANRVDYDLEPPGGYLVVKVQKAWLDNRELDAVAPDFVNDPAVYNRLYSTYNAESSSTPTKYLQKDERTISLWPKADRRYQNGLTMRVALKPTRASTEIEDVIFEDYAEAIAQGALYRLMASPGKAYTNTEMAVVNKGLFEQAINVARQRASRGHVRSNLSVKMRKI